MDLRYDVRVTPLANGDLLREVESIGFGSRETIIREVISTMDRATREGLIALGWTPPAQGSAAGAVSEGQAMPDGPEVKPAG
jgi:hypothetical protein